MKTTTDSKAQLDAMIRATSRKLGLRALSVEQVRFIRDDAEKASVAAIEMKADGSKYMIQAMACYAELARRVATVPYVETDRETCAGHTMRLSHAVRVF